MRIVYETEHVTLYHGRAEDVLPTLPRASVDLLATDPPYGVRWQSGNRSEAFDRIVGDDGALDTGAVMDAALRALRPHRHVYVFGAASAPADFTGLPLTSVAPLVWDKGLTGLGDLSLPRGPAHECITFGVYVPFDSGRKRGEGRLSARLRTGSVLRAQRPNARAVKRHPTEKPVALMRQIIESSSVVGETVLDPFAGSGSTLVAARLEGRRAVGIELDERYCAVAIDRLRAIEPVLASLEAA